MSRELCILFYFPLRITLKIGTPFSVSSVSNFLFFFLAKDNLGSWFKCSQC